VRAKSGGKFEGQRVLRNIQDRLYLYNDILLVALKFGAKKPLVLAG
jgi:hypothetical protein